MFYSWKVLRKEKKIKKNGFFILCFTVKNMKKKSNIIQIGQKFIYFKLFNLYVMKNNN